MSLRQFLVVALLPIVACFAGAQDDPVLVGTVTKVTDGDTISVQLSSGPITVRLDSIDAPERDQPWGQEAARALADLLAGEEVALEVASQDRYERLVATVLLGDGHVNAWMVEQGHAWAYRQYLSRPEYCEWEHEARRKRRGLWSLAARDQVAPWEWRLHERGGLGAVTDYSTDTVAACVAAIGRGGTTRSGRATPSSSHPGQCLIKGNISSNGRIYHVPGSRSYDATRIDESKGERWFCSEAEARAAGWRPPRQ